MLTTDTLLLKLFENHPDLDFEDVSSQDKKILISLHNQLKKHHFLTEKQGNLLVKLYWQYLNIIPGLNDKFKNLIEKPSWSQKFRILNPVRKIYFEEIKKSNIIIEFTYDKGIKDKLNTLNSPSDTICKSLSATKWIMKTTESNIVNLIDKLANDKFDIDQEIQEIYESIKEVIKDNHNYLDILKPQNSKLLQTVLQDVKPYQNQNLLLLDRRHRFQYDFNIVDTNDTLSFQIAKRDYTQIYINSNAYTLEQVITSLQELERFPLLLIFNKSDVVESNKILNQLSKIKSILQINSIGIYYRQDNNTDINKEFNKHIQDNKFNSELDAQTEIVGTASTFLPKFFYKTNWYPKSVISFTNNFKSNKVFTYCDAVDCIIYYTNDKPLSGKMNEIL